MIILIVGYFATNIVKTTYANLNQGKPDATITIIKDGDSNSGKFITEGNLFGDILWHPGEAYSGIIRIENQFKKVNISNLSIGLDLQEYKNEYRKGEVEDSFLKNMKLRIERGSALSFDKTIIDYTRLGDLLYIEGDDTHKGYALDDEKKFNINKGGHIDLKYTLYMDKEAENELQSVIAEVPFYINVNENPTENKKKEEKEKEVIVAINTDKHWAHDCIITLLNHRVIEGYPHEDMTIEDYRNGTVEPRVYVNEAVQPNLFITRAEAAVLIGKAVGLEEQDAFFTGYIDPLPDWAKGHIISTSKADIFKGYPFKLFKPNKYITREEMIAVLTRAFEIKLENEELELTFKDKEEISKWAEEYVKAGFEKEIIVGYPDNTYKPKNNITRAEAFTIICKLMGLHGEHTEDLQD